MAKVEKDYKKIEKLLYETKKNLFLTGPGGTGKTYMIKKYIEQTQNVVVCGTTGVAAVNAGGDTAHKLFCIPVPAYGAQISKVTPSKIKALVNADAVIIDEISMLRNDAFSFAIRVLKKAEREKGSKIRLIVVGDFSQLPPVVSKQDQKMLKKFKYDESGFAFTTKEWGQCNFTVCELTEVKRQDNEEFITELNKTRLGDLSCIDYFNRFVSNSYPETTITVCGTNAEADRINKEYIESLPGQQFIYLAEKKGRPQGINADEVLILKNGARVMFTVNDVIDNEYQNGTIGIIKECFSDYVDVEVNGKVMSICYHDFTSYSYSFTRGELKKKETGTISQLPLRLAKAITIHKSQGCTFEEMALSPQIFAGGQLYVALSRVRNPERLYLTEPIKDSYFIVDKTVSKFYKNDYEWEYKVTAITSTKKKSETKSATKSPAKGSQPTTTKVKTKKDAKPKKTKAASKKTTTKKKVTTKRKDSAKIKNK